MNVVWLKSAVADLTRLKQFIMEHNPKAAEHAARKIKNAVFRLSAHPQLGKPIDDLPQFRDLGIPFGAGGYVLRYRSHHQTIYVVHIRHYRENNFQDEP